MSYFRRPETPRVTDFEPGLLMGMNFNCLEIDDKYYNINVSDVTLESIEEHVKLYSNTDINKVPDGIYIWMIVTFNDDSTHIIFNKVYSVHEIGTKHQNIVNRIHENLKEIHLAGEFAKKEDSLWYNFLSGTYMLDNIDVKDPFDDALDDFNDFMETITNYELVYDNTGTSFINTENITFTHSDLDLFLKFGAEIHSFNTKGECIRSSKYKLDMARYNARLSMYNRQIESGKYPNLPKFEHKKPRRPKGTPYYTPRRPKRLKLS